MRMTPNTSERPSAVKASTRPEAIPSSRARTSRPSRLISGRVQEIARKIARGPRGFASPQRILGLGYAACRRGCPGGLRRPSERVLRVIRLRRVHPVLDRGGVDDPKPLVLYLGDVLAAEALVQPADKSLWPLRMLDAFGERLHRFQGLDEGLYAAGCAGTIPALLHGLLDNVQRLPAAEHVGV